MLSPDAPYSRVILGVVLAGLVVLLVLRAIRRDRRDYQRFKRFERTANRQRMLGKWLRESFVTFGSASVVILLLDGQYVRPLLDEVHTWSVARVFLDFVARTGWLVPGVAIGLAVLIVGGTVLVVYLARDTEDIPTIGDIGALLPRNRRELYYGAGLSVNAGLVEELLFRLAVPSLLYAVIGNALVAVVLAVLLFGALHAYQGVWGIVGSLLIGAVFMVLYLATGSIVVPIVAHALFDLRSLVLIPMIVYRVHRTA